MRPCLFLLLLVYLSCGLVCGVSVNPAYEVTFSLSNLTVPSLDYFGQIALTDSVIEVIEVINVKFMSQEPSDDSVLATVGVFVNENSNFLNGLLVSYDSLNLLLNNSVAYGDFTNLLRENAKSLDAEGMDNVQADAQTPRYINFDGDHDSYTFRTAGIIGIALGTFFCCLCCLFLGIMYLRHKGDYTEPQSMSADEVEFTEV